MTIEIGIIDAELNHLTPIWMNMAKDDWRECLDLGVRPRDGLRRSFLNSVWAKTLLIDGRVAAIWGVCGALLGPRGVPWLITTPAVRRAPIACIKLARAEMRRALDVYPSLVNFVSARHVRALRTMEAIGFSVGPERPMGKYGNPFCKIEMTR